MFNKIKKLIILMATTNYDEVVFDTIDQAAEILRNMEEIIRDYGNITVGDVLELCDLKYGYKDHTLGWSNLRFCGIQRREKGGWTLRLPKPKTIKMKI